MTTAGFLWPTKDEYDLAIARWQDTIFDSEVRSGLLAYDTMGICRFGGANLYVCVYKIGKWMVRCFCSKPSHAAPVDICERYMAIDRFCRKNGNRVSALIPVTYLEQGIIVGSRTLPLVKMPFLTGCPSLGEFIMDNYTDRAMMQQLSDAWFRMIHELETAPLAHGDLDLSNVLVERKDAWSGLTLKLIDYDNMWMPELAGRPQTEFGHANFQHPDFLPPRQRPYNMEMDRFSALVMYISLKALTIHPELYDAWGADESDRLLLAESDYLDADLVGSHIIQLREQCSHDMAPYIDELQTSLREGRMPRSLYDLANAHSSTYMSYRPHASPRLQPPPSFSAPVFKWNEAVYNVTTNNAYPLQGQTGNYSYATSFNGHQEQVQQPLQPVPSQNAAWNQGADMQSPPTIRSERPTHQIPESDSGLTYPASWDPQHPPNSPFPASTYNPFSTPPDTPFSAGSMPFMSPVRDNTPLPVMPTSPTNGKSKIITIAIIVALVLVIIAAGVALYMILTGNHRIGPLTFIAGMGYRGMGRRKSEFAGDEQPPVMGKEDGRSQGQCQFNNDAQLEDGRPQGQCQFNNDAQLEDGRPPGEGHFNNDAQLEDGRPPGEGHFNNDAQLEDGRPRGQGHFNNDAQLEDGRPRGQGHFNEQPPVMGKEDGRPQGAPLHVHTAPVPTMQRYRYCPDIVGTGVVWTWSGAPCGRRSRITPDGKGMGWGRRSRITPDGKGMGWGRRSRITPDGKGMGWGRRSSLFERGRMITECNTCICSGETDEVYFYRYEGVSYAK